MSDFSEAADPVVIILAACQPPGAEIAKAFAKRGSRVILIDADGKALTRIAARDPDQIETLALTDFPHDLDHLLKDAWGGEPLQMVINLMPLSRATAITSQMRTLKAIMRSTLRGLVAGKGSIVSLVARPDDPLALIGQGMVAAMQAASAALGRAVLPHPVRVHVISLPQDAPEEALDTLLRLNRPDAKKIASTTFDLS